MPYCTNCGKQNPDDARFCSQCGTRIASAEAAEPVLPPEPAVESTATITFGAPGKEESDERRLNHADSAAVDALPTGHALLVVQRGPSAGSRFLLDSDLVTAGRHPESEIFLDDVTVSRRHAEFRRAGAGFELSVGPVAAPETLTADVVMVTAPAPKAARLLADVAPGAVEPLGGIPYASMAVVAMAFAAQPVGAGSGLLVPPVTGRIPSAASASVSACALAMTWRV